MSQVVVIVDDAINPDVLEGDDIWTVVVGGTDWMEDAALHDPDLLVLGGKVDFGQLDTLRRDLRFTEVPIICRLDVDSVDSGLDLLDAGVDDYLVEPFEDREASSRVRAVLRRSRAGLERSPLTGMPGNFRIAAELDRRIVAGERFALIHCDLDDFKSYNDRYGFVRGDAVIQFCARCLRVAAQPHNGVFMGHIGGDDFAVIISSSIAEEYASEVTRLFDEGIAAFYDAGDVEAGGVELEDRLGGTRFAPLVGVSMGIASTAVRPLPSRWETSQIAAEMKTVAKRDPGSSYAVDRRRV